MNTLLFLEKQIKQKIIWVFTFILVVSLVAWEGLSKIESTFRYETLESLQTVLTITQASLNTWVSQNERAAILVASDPEFVQQTQVVLLENSFDSAEIQWRALATVREKLAVVIETNHYRDFFIISREGQNVASMYDSNLGIQNVIKQKKAIYSNLLCKERLFLHRA